MNNEKISEYLRLLSTISTDKFIPGQIQTILGHVANLGLHDMKVTDYAEANQNHKTMSKKVMIQIVKYDSISVELPDGFSENISEWTDEQKDEITEIANEQMYDTYHNFDWTIDEREENQGFLEVVGD